MDPTLVALVREAVVLVLLASAPPLAAALGVGLVVGVLQAATQIQDPAVGVVPRVTAVLVALGASGPWIGARVVRFAARCIELLPGVAP